MKIIYQAIDGKNFDVEENCIKYIFPEGAIPIGFHENPDKINNRPHSRSVANEAIAKILSLDFKLSKVTKVVTHPKVSPIPKESRIQRAYMYK